MPIFESGDDLGELTETNWPDQYKPKKGLGDLTGEKIIFNCANDVRSNFLTGT